MDLKRWTHVVAVADRRSFVRAAEQVHLSQPALTRSIQAAEAELGLALFDRGGGDVRVTPAGEFIVARARQLVFNSECLARDVALFRNRALGDTAFGTGPYPAATFLAPLLVDLRRDYPAINVRVQIANWELLLGRLLAEDLEFFVADSRALPTDARLHVRPLRRETAGFYARAGHPLAARRAIRLKEVWAFGVASVRLPMELRVVVAKLLGHTSGADLPLALECDDVTVLKSVALGGDAVLAAPDAAVAHEVAAGTLTRLQVSGVPPLFSQVAIVTLRGRTPSPMAQLIMNRLPATDRRAERETPIHPLHGVAPPTSAGDVR